MATISKWDSVADQMQKNCKGCRYYGNHSCDYILIKHESRPCKPGDKCTVKTKGKRKRVAPFGDQGMGTKTLAKRGKQ